MIAFTSRRVVRQSYADRQRHGFTLMELIVALVLGAILLITLVGVLRRSFAEIRVATSDDRASHRYSLLLEQLRRDVSNARRIDSGSNRLGLEGFIHRDPETLIATQRPARVIYEIRRNGTQSSLVRIQVEIPNGSPVSTQPWIELVYAGAGTLLVSSNQVGVLTESDRLGSRPEDRIQLEQTRYAIPSALQIIILDQPGRIILDHTFSRQRDSS